MKEKSEGEIDSLLSLNSTRALVFWSHKANTYILINT